MEREPRAASELNKFKTLVPKVDRSRKRNSNAVEFSDPLEEISYIESSRRDNSELRRREFRGGSMYDPPQKHQYTVHYNKLSLEHLEVRINELRDSQSR